MGGWKQILCLSLSDGWEQGAFVVANVQNLGGENGSACATERGRGRGTSA